MKNFLRGLLAGAAIGYLTAPRSGKKTRERISEKISGYKEDFENVRDKMVELVEDVKSQTGLGTQDGVFGKVESKIDQYKHKAYEAKEDVKDSYNQEVENVANRAKPGIDATEGNFKM